MLIVNGILITWEEPNQILEGHALYIRDGRIIEIAPQSILSERYPQEERLDACGQYVMPGSICAHTHFYGAYARGLAIPGPAPKDFPEILEKLWWPLDRALTYPDVQASAEVMLIDAIRHGATTVIDHHASPNAVDGSLDVIHEAVERAGLRAVLCYEVTDRNGPAGAKAGIAENLRFLKKIHSANGKDGARIAGTFGLHASLTLSEETLEACRDSIPNKVGFHIHAAEHQSDQYDSLAKSGQRVISRLYRHGILGPRAIVAHAVHVDAWEVKLLAETGTWVTHQPRSNMNNAVGVADVESLLHAGVSVCLGTDGFSSTMWTEWRTAYLLQKIWNRDPRRMSGEDVARISIYNNRRLASQLFPQGEVGVIAPGAFADLIFVDFHPHTPLTVGNLPWQIIFGFHESMVTTTIVAGQVLMRDRQLLTMDEEAITARALQLAPAVWQRYTEQF